jgi:hypothetical protein
MAKLSKFYRITNQILLEYITDTYLPTEHADTVRQVNYTVYTGLDNNLYYTEEPDSTQLNYSDSQYFIKFPNESQSEYNFFGYYKNENDKYVNTDIIKEKVFNNENLKYINAFKSGTANMYYDKIRLHFIYGFLFNGLAGLSLSVKTKAKYLGPTQNIVGYNHLEYDDYGNPVFKKIKDVDGNLLEPLSFNEKELILLDYFLPKESLNFDNLIKWHKTPIYQNGCFYDRYVEINVPSAYYLSLDGTNIDLSVPNVYGNIVTPGSDNCNYVPGDIKGSSDYVYYKINDTVYKLPKFNNETLQYYYDTGLYNKLPQYGLPGDPHERQIIYTVLSDPKILIDFATVQETNLTPILEITEDNNIKSNYKSHIYGVENTDIKYQSIFYQDAINQISLAYNSNTDYFNAVIYEDIENCQVIYYPTWGLGDDLQPLNYDIMANIENGQIPILAEGFYDSLNETDLALKTDGKDNIDKFSILYGEDAFKWIIYNELNVVYSYTKNISSLTSDSPITTKLSQHFSSIIDYGTLSDDEKNTEFYKINFVPKPPIRANENCVSIAIVYTCRLINRLSNIEAIRTATLTITGKDIEKYKTKPIVLKNVVTYNVFNKKQQIDNKPHTIIKESQDKYIRSYYDATNLVVKDMGTNAIYTQGQMILKLKRSSTNYMFRLFTINQDNIRVPYDLTGPYRYLLTFPTIDGNKIKIMPNKDSNDVKLGVGQLVFYITEQQVKRIMAVPAAERYFAITTDTDKNDQQLSTLYEGKVAYYS